MVCKEIKEIEDRYTNIREKIKKIIENRTCTIDVIERELSEDCNKKELKLILDSMIDEDVTKFHSPHTYEIGAEITYKVEQGIISTLLRKKKFKTANLLQRVYYKDFYMYRKRDAEYLPNCYIRDKLDFEVERKTIVDNGIEFRDAFSLIGYNSKEFDNKFVYIDTNDPHTKRVNNRYGPVGYR